MNPSRRPTNLERAVKGRVVLITGASSGIGRATAITVGAAGGITLLVARSVDKLEATKAVIERVGGVAHVYPCDMSDMDDVDRLATKVLDAHGHVDVLVNNAGHSIRRSVELSYDRFHDFERTMRLNYFGALRLILALLPTMRERKQGLIVNVSTAGVQTKPPRYAGYIASKAALDAFSDSVAAEVHGDGVRFSTIYMPLVRTPMIDPTPAYRSIPALKPEQAADMITKAIIFRRRRVGLAMGALTALLDILSPRPTDVLRRMAYRFLPDSPAARGETERIDTTQG